MITTRTPLRVTLGGGGSDLENGQGVCLSATIDKYVTVSVSTIWDPVYRLHYSGYEETTSIDEIKHRIIRRVFAHFDVEPGIEVSSIGEIPAGTGLGSSGAFTVGLLKALHPEASRAQLVRWACELDVGQQDQWSAVWGGVNAFDFATEAIYPVDTDIDKSLSLWYTGMRHDSASILTGPPKPVESARVEVDRMLGALDDPRRVGKCLTEQWLAKLAACPSREHCKVDGWLVDACRRAFGGKLVGAGNGGFILLAGPGELPLREVPFTFTHEGSRCV